MCPRSTRNLVRFSALTCCRSGKRCQSYSTSPSLIFKFVPLHELGTSFLGLPVRDTGHVVSYGRARRQDTETLTFPSYVPLSSIIWPSGELPGNARNGVRTSHQHATLPTESDPTPDQPSGTPSNPYASPYLEHLYNVGVKALRVRYGKAKNEVAAAQVPTRGRRRLSTELGPYSDCARLGCGWLLLEASVHPLVMHLSG
jgi:hypothetical protein